ncbi:MAG: hypothetical protein LW875_04380 [Proteobacteria bacterium]|jgi:hypothetical protein|nr:hypothetical protein [Pseudomonadota bacterium]
MLQYLGLMKGFFSGLLATLMLGSMAFAQSRDWEGYTQDVSAERSQRFYEIYLFSYRPAQAADLSQKIFNPLTSEFKLKYRETFGQVDAESISYQPANFGMLESFKGYNTAVEAENKKRKSFAEYMTKRLFEHHVDNYFKNDPTMRPVYETKEKLSNINVQVNQSFKFNFRYNLSNNTLDINTLNPWVDSKVTLEMNPRSFGPSTPLEERVWIGKTFFRKWRLQSNVANKDGVIKIESIHWLQARWTTSMGYQDTFKEVGLTTRQRIYYLRAQNSF